MIGWVGDAILDIVAWELGGATGEAIDRRLRRLTESQVRRRVRIHAALSILGLACIVASMLRPAWRAALYLFLGGVAVSVLNLAAFLELRRLPNHTTTPSSN